MVLSTMAQGQAIHTLWSDKPLVNNGGCS
jgi:hypothetical protein